MNVKFLIADEVRPEPNGKFTVLGLFAADTIVVLKRAVPGEKSPVSTAVDGSTTFERLAILISVKGAEVGAHSYKARINFPSGELFKKEIPFGDRVVSGIEDQIFVVEVKPFTFKERGTYIFDFQIDEIVYKFPFIIRDQSEQVTEQKKSGAKKAVAKKAVTKKAVTKKAVTKKAVAKKAVAKKAVAKKAVAKKTAK